MRETEIDRNFHFFIRNILFKILGKILIKILQFLTELLKIKRCKRFEEDKWTNNLLIYKKFSSYYCR